MSGTFILVELGGHVGLLLWGTHMVTSGVQRGFGTELRSWLGRNLNGRWRAFLTGVGITALLQSSTATGLMVTSFTASGFIGLGTGLAVMLGANLGTTLITQLLSFNIVAAAPPLILAGVITFRWSSDHRFKNLGRIIIGLGLMLMALAGLGQTLAPVESAPSLATLLERLNSEPMLLVLIAAVLTWACHSSVAVVLLIVSLAADHVVGPTPALALVLGANIGGTLPTLLEAGSPTARRLPLGNMLVRAIGCAVALPLLPFSAEMLARLEPSPARLVVDFHTLFNLALALAFILPTDRMAALLVRFLPDPPNPSDPGKPRYLEAAALGAAGVALANASRETLRMADMVEDMLRGALEVFRQDDRRLAADVSRTEKVVDRLGAAIRSYLADLGNEQPLDDEDEGARVQEILAAVINLEHVADIVANSLMEFAIKKIKRGHALSPEELDLIGTMHGELVESLHLALTVFLRGGRADADRLLARKAPLREMETQAAALHVRLVRAALAGDRGSEVDVLSSVAEERGLFLRIVRDLRRIHSHLARLAYPILDRAHDKAA